MIKVTLDVINKCASSLKFRLSEGQDKLILSDFDTVLAQIDYLKSIPGVDQMQEMTFPYKDHQHKMREDKPVKPVKTTDLLKNSNTKIGNQIKLPKVVGNENE
ncbi:MAG: hypothetical protein SPK64_02405 [Candidatus Enterosoma sp.]|nr:hypothetical protein [Bacilli bacterium]MDD7607515.1 hypothetical protein [bacterium]MDY3907342.1 hypothetical protein [Candidatus Enterosoma sp.]MDY5649883.1 hypothetical protein [Candidatus Enterosoma sp.]MDY5865684.1 hypothetical protein [Candidatus Enterosoma sp.]